MGCRSRMICVGKPAETARCDTPVPQPLSVMNSVKAYNLQLSEGRGSSFGITGYKYCPTSSLSRPTSFRKKRKQDPLEELEESNWSAKGGYGWVAADVRDQSSLFRWARLLKSWLNCTPVMSKGVSGDIVSLVRVSVIDRVCHGQEGATEKSLFIGDIVSLERVSAIDRVCHGQEGATEKFLFMYMCHFSQLHVRLPFDDFTMGVLRALNVAPTQLHPNSWAYLQAFRILCESLYLEPTPYAFLYFYDTRPRRPATWLSLISRPSISRLDAFSQSFKHFKDGWTNNPSRYKDMGVEELSAGDQEVVGMLLRFVDKLPTKGLVRVYNSVHPIIDIEGHMAQSGKKNLALFQSLRKEMAAKAKAAGKADVPNLQDSVVEVHVHGGTKRKAELPPRPGKGKDVKKIRAAILGSASGAGSASGERLPEAGLIELSEISVRKDISINLPDTVVNSIDNMEVDHIV
ncbi:hypothetical protein DEO72_LG5g1864 [Vigna unguiculata]|uniref:Transposase (putative) gypsy type domain-containing protein n=1 Tax=Vigna unguiculata TaxID=3917 RepID=A0A4D6LZL4_VIGUN|nr:hypothetical protein DEO72_LG5g1864 [Vigna unguiculata]